ncbi:hypothetical protein VHUM_02775 [Vanrija humicola]|uniref:DUF3533 domain-containing protein n=1 Tax=Vanrija humicola TaxID=5417 RepID=A0A7D8ZLA1_VANHU|nr:hypothetical protein VHUM_02775 [Vanrija humicola]
MWLCLPFYWGSLWKSDRYTDKLTVRVIDRDGGVIGQTVSEYLVSDLNSTKLRYFRTSPDELPTFEAVEHDVVQEGVWATVVINAGASASLTAARIAGDASYNGANAISVVYAQARSETAFGSYIIPALTVALNTVTQRLSAQESGQYLASIGNNATAVAALARAPQTLTQAVAYTWFNIRPYNQPVATAITLVGLIYMLIFSFIMTMTNNAAREVIGPYMTNRAYIAYRLIAPVCLYFVISFFFAMVNLPFKIHFGAHFTYAGGFFLWWIILFLGMTAVGYATEFAITIVGPKFVAFFLVPLIIANVSVVNIPHELQPWIFRYGVAMPFYNCSRTVRTIIFNTKAEFGKDIGILLAWIFTSMITISLATLFFRRKTNTCQKSQDEGQLELERVLSDGRVV